MGKRKPHTINRQHAGNASLTVTMLYVLIGAWALFALWRMIPRLFSPDDHIGNLRAAPKSAAHNILLTNNPMLKLHRLDRLLILTPQTNAPVQEYSEFSIYEDRTQAMKEHFRQLSPHEQNSTAFVVLHSGSEPDSDLAHKRSFDLVRRELLGVGVDPSQIFLDPLGAGMLPSTIYLRTMIESVKEIYNPPQLTVEVFQPQYMFEKVFRWIMDLNPPVTSFLVVNTMHETGLDNVDSRSFDRFLSEVEHVRTFRQLQGYVLLGGYKPLYDYTHTRNQE